MPNSFKSRLNIVEVFPMHRTYAFEMLLCPAFNFVEGKGMGQSKDDFFIRFKLFPEIRLINKWFPIRLKKTVVIELSLLFCPPGPVSIFKIKYQWVAF